MRVFISSPGETPIDLVIPTRMLFNRLTVWLAGKMLDRFVATVQTVDKRDLRRFIREMNRLEQKYSGMDLVKVESADGGIVRIRF